MSFLTEAARGVQHRLCLVSTCTRAFTSGFAPSVYCIDTGSVHTPRVLPELHDLVKKVLRLVSAPDFSRDGCSAQIEHDPGANQAHAALAQLLLLVHTLVHRPLLSDEDIRRACALFSASTVLFVAIMCCHGHDHGHHALHCVAALFPALHQPEHDWNCYLMCEGITETWYVGIRGVMKYLVGIGLTQCRQVTAAFMAALEPLASRTVEARHSLECVVGFAVESERYEYLCVKNREFRGADAQLPQRLCNSSAARKSAYLAFSTPLFFLFDFERTSSLSAQIFMLFLRWCLEGADTPDAASGWSAIFKYHARLPENVHLFLACMCKSVMACTEPARASRAVAFWQRMKVPAAANIFGRDVRSVDIDDLVQTLEAWFVLLESRSHAVLAAKVLEYHAVELRDNVAHAWWLERFCNYNRVKAICKYAPAVFKRIVYPLTKRHCALFDATIGLLPAAGASESSKWNGLLEDSAGVICALWSGFTFHQIDEPSLACLTTDASDEVRRYGETMGVKRLLRWTWIQTVVEIGRDKADADACERESKRAFVSI